MPCVTQQRVTVTALSCKMCRHENKHLSIAEFYLKFLVIVFSQITTTTRNNHIVQVISSFIKITKSIVDTSTFSNSNEFAVYSYFLLNSIRFMVYCHRTLFSRFLHNVSRFSTTASSSSF
jgi:hypothetical protein